VKNDKQLSDQDMINYSRELFNIPLVYAFDGKDETFEYDLYFYFNGIKINIFSHGIVAILRSLYDKETYRATVKFNIGKFIVKGSSRPDDNMNFFMSYKEPIVSELEYPLFNILECISIEPRNLSSKHKILAIHNDFMTYVPLPLRTEDEFSKIRYVTPSILNNKRSHSNFPSLYTYFVENDRKIRSRYFRTSSILSIFRMNNFAVMYKMKMNFIKNRNMRAIQ
jgi:hypothetical protein